MAHFAKMDDNDIVLEVHVVNNEDAPTEELGIQFLIKWCRGTHLKWRQCSYNGNIRKNYPGPGFKYDATRDAFIAPQPFPSWVLDEATCRWNAPTPMPTDGKMYSWDEETLSWIEVGGVA